MEPCAPSIQLEPWQEFIITSRPKRQKTAASNGLPLNSALPVKLDGRFCREADSCRLIQRTNKKWAEASKQLSDTAQPYRGWRALLASDIGRDNSGGIGGKILKIQT
jgi:hypothetical protein